MESVKNAKNKKSFKCHDCNKEIKIEDKTLKNGVLLTYKEGERNIEIFKCNNCFKKNPALTNYQKCEVYSRVVGYLRPVQQWNVGKIQEFEERKNFKVSSKDL